MSWDDLAVDGVTASVSPHDTKRFGKVVLRVVVGSHVRNSDAAAGPLLNAVSRRDVDLAVVRWPASFTELGAHLTDAGLTVVPADTLVYWAGGAAKPENGPIKVAPLSEFAGELRAFEDLVRATFDRYESHYAASPDLDPVLVTEGYVEWALRTASEAAGSTFVAHKEGRLLAFATTRSLASPLDIEVELAGTSPLARGQGAYGALLKALLALLPTMGCRRLLISTQAGNVAVQRLWARGGLLPVAAFTTVHVRRQNDCSRRND